VVLDADTTALIQAGSALIAGTVADDGMPHASRAWGIDVLDEADVAEPPSTRRIRLLLAADDERAIAALEPGRPLAITAADVPTLRSVQLKGTSVGMQPSRPEDHDRMLRYVDAFYDDITSSDGTPRTICDRLTPDAVVAVLVDVHEVFDQTPGPAAGQAVSAADRDRS
jgi:hypothetical protein